jgi:acyl dehydratase
MSIGRNLTDPTRVAAGEDLERGLKEPVYENIEIPEDFGPVDLVIDDLKIKRFAFVADDFGDWYLKGSPWGPRIGQPGLLANDLLQMFTMRYAPSQVVGLHTTEELWWERPVMLGQRVRLTARYTDKYEQRGQGSVVMEAEARDVDGSVLVRHRGVEIMRTNPSAVGGRASAGPGSGPRITGDYDTTIPVVDELDASVVAGTGLAPLRKEVTFEQMAVFSRIGEFVRNIHNDLEKARATGLRVPIVQGQQQVCYLAERAARAFGAAWFTGGWLKVKFLRPVNAFDVIEIAGAVREIATGEAVPTVDLDLWVRGAEGKLATVAWARCTLNSHAAGSAGARGSSRASV